MSGSLRSDGTPRIRFFSIALTCLIVLTIGLLGCRKRLEDTGSVFENLTFGTSQAAKPRDKDTLRTEYPEVGSWGPRVSEYRGEDQVRAAAFEGQGTNESGGGYQVNFDNAELSEVVRVILLDTLKTGYVLDPNVVGKVTVTSPNPLSRTELLQLLESVLKMNRAVMVSDGKRYKIGPAASLRAGGSGLISYASERQKYGPGYGISVLPLRHVSAREMIRLLGSFVTHPGSLKAEASRNLLLIRGTTSERNNLLSVASTFDVDWLRGQSAGIYRLLYATPDEMIAELKNVFETRQGAPGQNLIRFEPIKRLNAILVLTKRRKLLGEVATWVKRLDKTSPLSNSLYVYRVEHGKAKRLASLLNKMFAQGAGLDPSEEAEVAPGQSASVTATSDPAATGNITTGSNPRERTPVQSEPIGAAIAPPDDTDAGSGGGGRVHVVADELQNKLLIRSSLRDYKKIVGILARLDQPAAQVLIKATLAEVQLNKALRYGVQAFLQNSSPNGVLGFSNGTSLTIAPTLPGLNFLVGLPSTPKVILDALSNKTSVRLVSSPSLVVVNSGTAVLQVGDDVPIATRQAVSVTDPAAPIVNDIEFRKTGVILKVTPQINSDGLVTMEVEQEISQVSSTQTNGQTGTLTPTISQRRIVSTISVYSGQMVVLGGLVSERTSKFANRVPILEKVPLVGDAVGKTDDSGARTELVIFIQPQVIRDASDATHIADELRARLGSLAPDDRRRRRVLKFKDDWRDRFNGHEARYIPVK